MNQLTQFQLKVADVVFDVRCCFASTFEFCAQFVVPAENRADDSVLISIHDLETERSMIQSKKDANERLGGSSLQSIEILVLCRKIAEALPRHGAVLFHGSALACDGQGVLFTATSGTGKSTHSAIWRRVYGDRVQMINDDKPFLKLTDEGVMVCGSPWMGKHRIGTNADVPLKSICILNRGAENRTEPVNSREAMPLLIQQTYRPEAAEALLHSMRIVDAVSRRVDIYRIFCNMDDQAARVVCERIFKDCKED